MRSVNQFAALQEEGAQLLDENESSLPVGEIPLNREEVQNESSKSSTPLKFLPTNLNFVLHDKGGSQKANK